ncbi:uncharacterized protein LOC127150004 [Cucumis melo]|uniref:Uncharacterized protein LOC127150004 n=1 Tax=Cucumis melo TaxID=3656 RepID=A0ABM3KXS7_CUCME|nr:uncharacterized protein LOC127150004 [Cucumis melo]
MVYLLQNQKLTGHIEEQASVGNARALNAIFNGIDLNGIKLINSCITTKEAWTILEVAYEDYNKRVLEIANELLLLGEKIPESKIVRKVLRSLLGKLDMKVTTIEEAHNITKLKLDELFGSLLTFEMAISHRENKKDKGITFNSVYEEETTINQSDNEANMNESIALLTKQNGGEINTRRYNKVSNRSDSDDGRKKEGEGRFFRCRECGGVGHYQVECPTFLRRQKKIFRATLSDEDIDDSEEDNGMNAFTEDSEAREIQKERIQDLMEENERLMSVISSLKLKLKEVQNEYD